MTNEERERSAIVERAALKAYGQTSDAGREQRERTRAVLDAVGFFDLLSAAEEATDDEGGGAACEHGRLRAAIAKAKGAQRKAPAAAVQRNSCNRHDDCAAANERARAAGRFSADHCHDEGCEECFGY